MHTQQMMMSITRQNNQEFIAREFYDRIKTYESSSTQQGDEMVPTQIGTATVANSI